GIALGAAAGLIVRAVFASLALAGELMSMQMGLQMAQLFDPVQGTQQGPVSVLSTLLASLVFLQLDLHATVLLLLVRGFETVPPGTFDPLAVRGDLVIDAVGSTFRFGLQLSAPVLVLVLLINTLVGILGKLAPRMNVFFSVGPTLTTAGSIALLAQALPALLAAHADMLKDVLPSVVAVWGR
ncbi:MAG: flagellar biosynthetic protein FliR, partial [Myxococcales bacterium]|nr:flagellar biosynthetic protein FliR [Myxococcales bacterium]